MSKAAPAFVPQRAPSWWARGLAVPSGRLVALSAPLVLLAAAVVIWPPLWAPLVACDLVLLAVALADLIATRGAVEARREVTEVQAVGRPFSVRLCLRNRSGRPLSLVATDDAPGETEGLPVAATVPPGTAAEMDYELVVSRRGQHGFGPVTVRWPSPLGLWLRQRAVDVEGQLRVYPDFQQLRRAGLVGRPADLRVPVRARRRPGGENEFQRLRPYVPGDPYKHIDWRATARRREFTTREFGQESNQNLIFMLDMGRMMSARTGELTAFDHALNAAVIMGQTALRHGDRVGLLGFDSEVRAWLPPRGGARHGAALIRSTYDLFPTLEEPDYALAFRHLSARVRRRSLVVLLTAVVDEVNADLARRVAVGLRARHLPLVVWIRDPELDRLVGAPTDEVNPFTRGAASELLTWRERNLQSLRRRGALVVDARPDELTAELLGRYLEIKARRLL